ncbi:MAG: DEAD/DEAH box helicase [Saprospiraceae bacterium]|nr:DEAD/DEAH box helicase [Saprospiraceae bacterium]
MAAPGFQLIINLVPQSLPGLIAQIWAAPATEDGAISVVTQKLTTGNAPDFGIQRGDTIDTLLRTAEDLETTSLIRNILRNPKKLPTPEAFAKDEKNMALLRKRADRLIDQWITLAVSTELPVALGLDRLALVSSHQLHVVQAAIQPALTFSRTSDGMRYRLRLQHQGKSQSLLGQTLQVLGNQPAWLVLNRFLIRLDQIHGNMLKPFTQKEEVHIPEKLLKTYVQKFLMKASLMADVETEGFEIRIHNTIHHVSLRTIHHVFQNETHLGLEFDYGGLTLADHSDIRFRQGFSDPEKGPLVIDRYERNSEAELHWQIVLREAGLTREVSGTGVLSGRTAVDEVIDWLIDHSVDLKQAGITIQLPVTEWGTVLLESPILEMRTDDHQTDWFDIHATVRIGDRSLPFVLLARTILDQQHFHALDDGHCFLVPTSWLTDYRDHFLLGEVNGDHLRMTRAQGLALKKEVSTSSDSPTGLMDIPPLPAPADLQATLRPYQLFGFQWLAAVQTAGLGACLADDMGLGKTLQTIALLLHMRGHQEGDEPSIQKLQLDLFAVPERPPLRALIILPATLVFNWKEEIQRFAPQLRVYVHSGKDRYQDPGAILPWDVVLTTYNLVVRDLSILSRCPFSCLVLDESQQIKNHRSQTFKAVESLKADFRLALTGTPVENSLSDLWAQMQFINPGLLGPYPDFRENYQRPIEKDKDPEREEALRQLVRPFLLRRKKQEVATDLPPLTEQVIYCDMDDEQARIYEEEKSAVRNVLLEQLRTGQSHRAPHVLNALMRLRQIAIKPSIYPEYAAIPSGKEEVIRAELENLAKSGQQALIYSAFRKHLQGYADWLTSEGLTYTEIHGGIATDRRGAAVKSFQEGQAQFLLATLKAGGAGLNLTAAEYILLADPWWNPAVEAQAVGRGHRIGQDKPVFALKFITRNTIEEKILKLQERKEALKDAIVEQEEEYLGLLDQEEVLFLVDDDQS